MPQDKSTLELTAEDERAMCLAYTQYGIDTVGSAANYCRWQAQGAATGTTDADLQSSCAVVDDLCQADPQQAQEAFQYWKETNLANCDGASPLTNTFLRSYIECDNTVGEAETCSVETIDNLGSLKNVPCSQWTMARRDTVNSADINGASCAAIACQ